MEGWIGLRISCTVIVVGEESVQDVCLEWMRRERGGEMGRNCRRLNE